MKYVILVIGLPVLLTLKLSAQTLPVDDDKFGCTDQARAQKYVKDFNIDVKSFGGMELCNTAVDSKKLFNDLQLIEDGHLNSQGSNLLIKNFVPDASYYNWFKSETHGMERGNDIPYATAYNAGGYFTMQNGWALSSTLGRVGTVIHEARHTQGYRHIACNSGPYGGSGLAGCDSSYTYGGSHAVEMEYYARVNLQGENFHPVYKTMARLMAIARANFVFNQNPMRIRQGLLALDNAGTSHLLLDNKIVTRDTPTMVGYLKRTSFGADIFDGFKALAIELYQNSGVGRVVEDDYSYYKLLKENRGQDSGKLADVEEVDTNGKRYFLYLSETGKMGTFDFPHGQFNQSANAPNGAVRFATTSPAGASGLFVMTKNGEVYSVNPADPSRQAKQSSNWPQDVASYTTFNNQVLVLKTSGELTLGKTAFEPFKNLQINQVVTVPAYDAFEVIP